jgi:hypothetical protein
MNGATLHSFPVPFSLHASDNQPGTGLPGYIVLDMLVEERAVEVVADGATSLLHILVEEFAVEVVADGVVDELLLHGRVLARLVPVNGPSAVSNSF